MRIILLENISRQADKKLVAIVNEFLANYDKEIDAFVQGVEDTQNASHNPAHIGRAFSHLTRLHDLASTSPSFSRVPSFMEDLDALIKSVMDIGIFIADNSKLQEK